MAQTKIKAGLFEGIIGNGTDGYFLMSNGDGTMTWSSIITNPTITSIAYPGSATAADPAGGETITVTGTGFKTGATVTIGGTAAPAVSYVSATQITFTTPAKVAGDYDIVVTNTDTGSATFINGISYNGIPTWTTAAGSLGTFASDTTISTITLQATEPDAGTITFSITNGALPTGLSLTGANIDGTTSLETADTLYTFTVTATDDESQATPRTFTITVTKQFINTENFTINTYTGNGSTQSIDGKIGTAASFNGSSYISTQGSISGGQSFSISLWCYLNTSSAQESLFTMGSTSNNGFFIYRSGQQFALDSFGATRYNNNTFFTENTWQHLTITHSSGTNNIYLDGSFVDTFSYTWNINASATTYLGAQIDSFSRYLNGKLDQVRIFNKALSSSEVTTLYGESNTSTTKSTTDIFDDSSGVALYEFEEGAKDTGGTYNGTPTNVSFVGMAFQPDFVWLKGRNNASWNHFLQDSIRGAENFLISSSSSAEATTSPHIVDSFDTNGFTVLGNGNSNTNGDTYVAWCFKAGGTAVSNTDGSTTSYVSANQDAGFSIVKNGGSNTITVGHGLSQAPELIIQKRTDGVTNWIVHVASLGYTHRLQLNTSDAALSGGIFTNVNSSTFSFLWSSNPYEYINYCFHSVDGYQKVGSYTASGSWGTSATIDVGFPPRFVLIKSIDNTGSWLMVDSLRGGSNGQDRARLFANLNGAEGADTSVDFSGNTFSITFGSTGNQGTPNVSRYIYLAIA